MRLGASDRKRSKAARASAGRFIRCMATPRKEGTRGVAGIGLHRALQGIGGCGELACFQQHHPVLQEQGRIVRVGEHGRAGLDGRGVVEAPLLEDPVQLHVSHVESEVVYEGRAVEADRVEQRGGDGVTRDGVPGRVHVMLEERECQRVATLFELCEWVAASARSPVVARRGTIGWETAPCIAQSDGSYGAALGALPNLAPLSPAVNISHHG
jgi:hypothetical protein